MLLYFEGLLKLWYGPVLIVTFLATLLVFAWIFRFSFQNLPKRIFSIIEVLKKDRILLFLISFFLLLILFNLIGALAPEKEFDALWYHLTLPKIWLQEHRVQFIEGGLLYYSAMPKLAEMLYGLTLAMVKSGLLAKILHLLFGVFWALFSYEILREFFNRRLSLLLTIVIYSLSMVTFLSGTAYIDLIVAFFIAGILWGLIKYFKEGDTAFLYLAAIFMGFALSTKTYSLMMLAAVSFVLLLRKDWRNLLKFGLIAFLISFPFYLFSYLATGNPIYPIFSLQDSSFNDWIAPATSYKDWLLKVWPLKVVPLFWRMMAFQLAPIFGLGLLLPFYLRKGDRLIFNLSVFFLIFFLLWSWLPVWEPRYFFVILPVLAVLLGIVIDRIPFRSFKWAVAFLIILGLFYNGFQSYLQLKTPAKFTFKKENRGQYLTANVGSIWFNFYDGSGFLEKNFKANDLLLTADYHNLFYVPVKFIDWSTIDDPTYFKSAEILANKLKERKITYIAIADKSLSSLSGIKEGELAKYFIEVHRGNFQYFYKIK